MMCRLLKRIVAARYILQRSAGGCHSGPSKLMGVPPEVSGSKGEAAAERGWGQTADTDMIRAAGWAS